ncbi:molecular chaperone [Shewanella waksmanii]|uniref:molecular chaperone n=1 Tax=Shewanella waksmanii TaxID=213783 RepID=UPI0037354F4B
MFVGFDYGSANCAVGTMVDGQVKLAQLTQTSQYISSTLYAMDRELISEAVLHILPKSQQSQYAQMRSSQLARARTARRELDLDADEQAVFVGQAAIDAYMEMPEEGFYVRSPKSFLGAKGLRAEQVALFEDIVTLMMSHVKRTAEANINHAITHAVIGRPVNFQGIGGEESNQQAEAILRLAAQRAGFADVAFLYEPIAAGMDYEASLNEDRCVLVVDVGGGTTDCSMVNMGPSHSQAIDRSADFLAHTGQRIGGNDLDIALAMGAFMPHLGLHTLMNNGLPVPSKPFWNAVAVNDISAQREFASLSTKTMITDLIKDAREPSLLSRLLKVQQDQLGYRIVRSAESVKIALTDNDAVTVQLDYLCDNIKASVDEATFIEAIGAPSGKIVELMSQAVEQAGRAPEVIYVTGGTARSPAIYQVISGLYPQVPVVVGDHFGSVTAGLTRWAQKMFK